MDEVKILMTEVRENEHGAVADGRIVPASGQESGSDVAASAAPAEEETAVKLVFTVTEHGSDPVPSAVLAETPVSFERKPETEEVSPVKITVEEKTGENRRTEAETDPVQAVSAPAAEAAKEMREPEEADRKEDGPEDPGVVNSDEAAASGNAGEQSEESAAPEDSEETAADENSGEQSEESAAPEDSEEAAAPENSGVQSEESPAPEDSEEAAADKNSGVQNEEVPAPVQNVDPDTIIGVRFREAGKVYYFTADFPVKKGDHVIVETSYGQAYGYAAGAPVARNYGKFRQAVRPVLRVATPADEVRRLENLDKEAKAFEVGKQKIEEHKLDMKLISTEYTFDGSKILFYFTADGRIDFRDLVKDLAGVFRTRIELRQIGVRDETRMLGGYGSCGRPLCCASYLTDFVPVSIKMAKEQSLSLNPTKISGVCGRLMCCLKNEEETYEELNRNLPGLGDEVEGADGLRGEVESVNVLRQTIRILVEVDDEKELHEYGAGEFTILRRHRRGQARKTLKSEAADAQNRNGREGSKPMSRLGMQVKKMQAEAAEREAAEREEKALQEAGNGERSENGRDGERTGERNGERGPRGRRNHRGRGERPDYAGRGERQERNERFERNDRQERDRGGAETDGEGSRTSGDNQNTQGGENGGESRRNRSRNRRKNRRPAEERPENNTES